MFSTLRTRFGIPGVISVMALVFAMFGGAYAASNDSGGGKATASAKKAKKGPRGPKGATGPAGPIGPVGPAGPKGDAGANGSNGKDGTNGTNGSNGASVASEEFVGVKEGHCTGVGGTKFTSASGSTFACNGKNGSPWAVGGTLPSGATETGTWIARAPQVTPTPIEESTQPTAKGQQTVANISFPVPLASTVQATIVTIAEGSVPGKCPGVVEGLPKAEPGNLCLYTSLEQGTPQDIGGQKTFFIKANTNSQFGVSPAGTMLMFFCDSPTCLWWGTWAVAAS